MVRKPELILALLEMMRPAEWSKTFGNMVIAALLATTLGVGDWVAFLVAFIAAGPLLWGGLYALNDWTDWQKDARHPVKKCRPIPSGRVKPEIALAFSLSLLVLAFAVAYFYFYNLYFIICLTAMMANQTLYTMRPFHLKSVAALDLVSGSLINPFFRFYSGWVIFVQGFTAPLEMVLFVVAVQFGGYTLYRLASKKQEEEYGYRSSIVVFPEGLVRGAAYLAVAVSGIAFVYSAVSGIIAARFLILAVLSVLAAPLYYQAMKDPQKMDMKKVYRLIYIHYALFIAGFILLSYITF
jgi:4-hydroxybenzoate polyprenyltransferase